MTSVILSYTRPRSGVEGPFCDSLAALLVHDARHKRYLTQKKAGGFQSVTAGPDVAGATNLLAKLFLGSVADWWLCVDTDMAFHPDLCDRLVGAADPRLRPIVAANCLAVPETSAPYTPVYWFDQGKAQEVVANGLPADSLVEVDGTGFGAVLIHRNVVVRLFGEFDGEPFSGSDAGEDLTFMRRAREAGFPVFLHTGIKVGHTKPHTYWPQEGAA